MIHFIARLSVEASALDMILQSTQRRYQALVLYIMQVPFFQKQSCDDSSTGKCRELVVKLSLQWVHQSLGIFLVACFEGQQRVPPTREAGPTGEAGPAGIGQYLWQGSQEHPSRTVLLFTGVRAAQSVLDRCLTVRCGSLCVVHSSSPGWRSSQREHPSR